jgi:hypothetical protein
LKYSGGQSRNKILNSKQTEKCLERKKKMYKLNETFFFFFSQEAQKEKERKENLIEKKIVQTESNLIFEIF